MANPYYYQDQAGLALTTSFVQQSFGFGADEIVLYNDDATNDVLVSFDGSTVHMRVIKGTSHKWDKVDKPGSIYLKSSASTPAYRLTAWQSS